MPGPRFDDVRPRIGEALAHLTAHRAMTRCMPPARPAAALGRRIDAPTAAADPQRKMAAPEGAAKFREETPRKGGGIAERKSAMPRCNNMAERLAASQAQNADHRPQIFLNFSKEIRDNPPRATWIAGMRLHNRCATQQFTLQPRFR